ncbi:bacteriohemerythrin [Noviherbaspirillum sp. UKPF54]|nr:bacteriohemerythrin [Noviherbaspirillum sp. UKPF54]
MPGVKSLNMEKDMAYFAWTDELQVGNSFIDSDHQKLISLLNQLHEAMAQGQGKNILGKILDELIRYTREHFKREEDHMQKIRYADFAAHKQEHDKLIKEVVDLQAKFNAGNGMLSVQVSGFLRNWLINHIMKTDKLLASALKQAAA